jgi:Zn-dependent peptidase ImmA (M78 family)
MKKLFAKVLVLGQEYKIYLSNEKTDSVLKDKYGYTHYTEKYIVIDDDIPNNKFKQHIIKHELVHAFLQESGLHTQSDWASNEEIVDWIALQLFKMDKTCKETIGLLKDYNKKRSNAK